MERIRRFVIKIKEVIEKCLKARMTKQQMFRWVREKGVHPRITYTVCRELRQQNQEFFKAYYLMAYVNRQIERFDRQLVAYRVLQQQAEASALTPGSNQGCDGSNPSSSGNNNAAAAATYRTTTTHAATCSNRAACVVGDANRGGRPGHGMAPEPTRDNEGVRAKTLAPFPA